MTEDVVLISKGNRFQYLPSGHNDVETTLCCEVETTSKKWSKTQIKSTSKLQRCFNVDTRRCLDVEQRSFNVIYQVALRRWKTGQTPRILVSDSDSGTRSNFIRPRTTYIYNVDYISTLMNDVLSTSNQRQTELGVVLAVAIFSFIQM